MKTLFVVVLFAAAAYAQSTTSATFHFTTPQTTQSLQEALTIVRTVASCPQVTADEAQTLTFEGTQAQVSMAQWMLTQLDTKGNENLALEYKSPAGDDVARVTFLANVSGAQQMQEVLTVLRTVADIARIFNYTPRQALVLRGKTEDIAFAEWLIDQLNLPASRKPDTTPRIYAGTLMGYGRAANIPQAAQVNYLTNITSPQGMQEALTILRTVGDIAKVFNYSALHAFSMKGNQADISRAQWMIQELNQPQGAGAGAQVYQTPGADDITRIFFLSNATGAQMSAAAQAIRAQTTKKVFYMTSPAALVVRGTSDQIEAAVQLMAQRNGLAD
jgi:hypothetical protein